MNTLKFSLAFTILLTTGATATAESSTGTVVRFDKNPHHSMTLTTGEVIILPAGLNLDRINSGDKVGVIWSLEGSNRLASKVSEFVKDDHEPRDRD